MVKRRGWLPFVTVVLAVAVELWIAGVVGRSAAAQPAAITALFALTTVAVATSLWAPMGLAREGWGLRLIVAVPFVLSAGLVVVLMLEQHVHRDARLMGGW